ncbi:MAG: GNAT family N-acetyltransferase [Bacteroidales bacterium]|nr:GNAT family N-acetyltransferase [Candidatus Scybalousia scybalohippi]
MATEQQHCLCVHPLQIDDINRDKDKVRRDIVLSRLKQYSKIKNPPVLSDEERERLELKESNDNDKVDNNILFALYRGAVNVLVTNDEGIHKKASHIGIQDKVYRLEQMLLFLKRYSNKLIEHTYTGVQERYLYEIDKNQSFFDSLRQSYDGFDNWYQQSAEKQRKCWCIEDDNKNVVAISIYKHEQDVQITDDGEKIEGKILKLCTFKVDAAARGKKLGERLLFIAFDYCVKNDIDWVYLHTYGEEQKTLVGLCEEYGFYFLGKYKKDDVYIKPMKLNQTDLGSLESLIRYYPFFQDNDNVQKYIIPIQPKYHEDLFPDFSSMKGSLFESDQSLYSSQGNTIKKAYLCHSNTKSLKKGDVVLFYRSSDRRSIQCMGIVEDAFTSDNVEEVFPKIAKRTVYTHSDLRKILSQETLIILFRFIPLDYEISWKKIQSVGIKGNIQSIRKISNEQYSALNEK